MDLSDESYLNTSPPHHTFHSKNSTSHRTILQECGTVSWFVLNSLSAQSKQNKHQQRARSTCARACLAEHSRIRWVRRDSSRRSTELGHARDWTVTEHPTPVRDGSMKLATQFRAGQDSVTRAVRDLRISDSPAAPALPAPPSPTMRNARRPPWPKQVPREYLRCAQCGPVADAPSASSDGGLMQQKGQKHGGQVLLADSVAQLRWLGRRACVFCGTTRSERCWRCNYCGSDTPLRELRVGDTFQDRRQPGHQDVAARGTAAGQQHPQSSRPVPPGEPLDDSPLPNCPVPDVALTERDKQLLTELRRASAMALPQCVVSRYATAWAESLEGAMSGLQSWPLLCRFRSRLLLAEIPKRCQQELRAQAPGRISDLFSKVLGQQSSGPPRRTARGTQPQTNSAGSEPVP